MIIKFSLTMKMEALDVEEIAAELAEISREVAEGRRLGKADYDAAGRMIRNWGLKIHE